MIPTWNAEIISGQLLMTRQADFERFIQSLDGPVEVTVRKPKKTRSNQQNRYYWGVVVAILSDAFGYTLDEMHDALLILHSREHQDGRPDTLKRSSKMSTSEFEDYVERVRQWAVLEYQIQIPTPNEVDYGNT
jgi:hypothetical protein